jgi:hypothetical protein
MQSAKSSHFGLMALIPGPQTVTQFAYLMLKGDENVHFFRSYVNIVIDGPEWPVQYAWN